MPNIRPSVSLDTFAGIDNVTPDIKSPQGYLKEQVNLDIDKANNLTKRTGFTLKDTAKYHSLWSDTFRMFANRNNDLVELFSDGSFTVLVSNIGSDKLSFEVHDSIYYYTSRTRRGLIKGTSVFEWGIDVPNVSPSVTLGSGLLSKGYYQITFTYESLDGRESGAGVGTLVEITSPSRIVLNNLPISSNSEVAFLNIYSTLENGEGYYRVAQIPNGTTTYFINSVLTGDKLLQTFNLYSPPLGNIVRWAHGRMWVVSGKYIYWSQPYQYDLFDLQSSYYYFEEDVKAFCPVPGGIWICADQIYYASGKDPTKARLEEKELAVAVSGSDVKVSGTYLTIDNTPAGYKWLITTDKGMFVMFNDGLVFNLSETHVSMPKAQEAASLFVQENGINKYIALLKESQDSQNTAVGDLVTSTVVRNGITII